MPLLSAYFDTSVVSFLIKKDKKKVEILNFPYVYSKGLLSNQCLEHEFYESVIKKILSDRKIKIESCDILTLGFIDPPYLSLKTKFSVGVSDLIQNSDDYYPIVVNNYSFVTKDTINSFSLCKDKEINPKEDEIEQLNYYSNLCVYPQIVSDDISNQSDVDEKITQRIPSDFKLESNKKIMFTGGRFAQNVTGKELNYILILEMLKGFGAFDVYLDSNNAFLLSQTLKMYDKDQLFSIEDFVENLGLFIRAGGPVECLLSTGVGEDQFIEIEKDKIIVMPLHLDNYAKISIKTSQLGTLNLKTKGGLVGLVFDTRSDDKSVYKDVKLLNECLKQFGRTFEGSKYACSSN